MERARSGYTIIEVLIVLAVTGILFVAALALFTGQKSETEFSQAMHDLNSKIQSYVSDVGVSQFPASGQYACSLGPGNRPQLSAASGGTGSNQDCIFLGKAIQLVQKTGRLYAYTVLGSRTYMVNNVSVPVTSFANASPTAAIEKGADLTQEYNLSFDAARLVSAKISLPSDPGYYPPGQFEHDLVGFYNNLQNPAGSSPQGSQTLFIKAYGNLADNPSPAVLRADAQKCIEQDPSCSNGDIASWRLCYQSTSGNQQAVLNVHTTPSSITTDLSFTSCS